MSDIIYFISREKKALEKDGVFKHCCSALEQCFDSWTTEFKVIHYDKEACKKKQWTLEYEDIVENSQMVCELVDDLCNYALADLATKLVNSLASAIAICLGLATERLRL